MPLDVISYSLAKKALESGGAWHTIPRVDKSTDVQDAWVDVDCSDCVPEGAKAVAVLFCSEGTYGSTDHHYAGARKNGATDEGTYACVKSTGIAGSRLDIVELDENRIFEQKVKSPNGNYVKTYIVGYLK